MNRSWFNRGRVVKNPVCLWLPVNDKGSLLDWDFDVVAVGLPVIKGMGGCDCCGCTRRRAAYVLADDDQLLCQRCFFERLDSLEEQVQSLAAS